MKFSLFGLLAFVVFFALALSGWLCDEPSEFDIWFGISVLLGLAPSVFVSLKSPAIIPEKISRGIIFAVFWVLGASSAKSLLQTLQLMREYEAESSALFREFFLMFNFSVFLILFLLFAFGGFYVWMGTRKREDFELD